MFTSSAPLSEKIRQNAATISLVSSIVVLGLKALAYYHSHSAAILSDALESVVNVLAAIVALGVIIYVSQPADREHPYGHGKMEYFSAAFEGGMIFFASLMILSEAIKYFYGENKPRDLEEGIAIVCFATTINLALGLYLRHVGRAQNSETLQASSAHVLSDCWSTGGVIVGLFIVKWTGIYWLDPLMAVLVALNLGYEGFRIVKKSLNALIDGMDTEALQNLSEAIKANQTEGVIDIHHVRSIRSGRFHHIDAHIVVPEFWDVKIVHAMTHEFEGQVVKTYKYDGEFAFHVDPCGQNFCRSCRVSPCHIRKKDFEFNPDFSVEHLIDGPRYTV